MSESATAPLSGAERMRRCRDRRRHGLRCLLIDLREAEIETLMRRSYLAADECGDIAAVRRGLYRFFDRVLM